ncbi:calcineurin b [Anaeramoeba flamelloides]|uniref:Calcineurin b n=1 Tax=Anaeramoeba flamelloides TaxID=1746091 RepID=A0AAV7YBV8_9EUKA|nr:calcineurin b [Anaeramoeba flamelloides]
MGNICPSKKEIKTKTTKKKEKSEKSPLLEKKEKSKNTSENDSTSTSSYNLEPKKYQSKLRKKEIEELMQKTKFTKEQILLLFDFFKKISAMIIDDDIIDNDEFEEALGLAGSKFATRLFEGLYFWIFFFFYLVLITPTLTCLIWVVDSDENGKVDFDEFCLALVPFSDQGTIEDRVYFSFQVYDINGNGQIEKSELFLLLNSCLEDQFKLSLGENELQNIVDQTFNEIDTDGSGTIDYEEYMIYAKLHPKIMENLKIELPCLSKKK